MITVAYIGFGVSVREYHIPYVESREDVHIKYIVVITDKSSFQITITIDGSINPCNHSKFITEIDCTG